MRSQVIRMAFPVIAVALTGLVVGTSGSRDPQHASMHQTHLAFETSPDKAYLDQRLGHGGQPLADDTFAVIASEVQNIRAQTLASDPLDANQQWTFDGPTNIGGNGNDGGGRVTDVAVDPAHAGTVYIATAGGGI